MKTILRHLVQKAYSGEYMPNNIYKQIPLAVQTGTEKKQESLKKVR